LAEYFAPREPSFAVLDVFGQEPQLADLHAGPSLAVLDAFGQKPLVADPLAERGVPASPAEEL
jgi:hypothetical protein